MKKTLKRMCDTCGEPGATLKRGETYLEASTMHDLERLKTHRRASIEAPRSYLLVAPV